MFTLGRNRQNNRYWWYKKAHAVRKFLYVALVKRLVFSKCAVIGLMSLHLTSLWYDVWLQTTENHFSTTVSTSLILIPGHWTSFSNTFKYKWKVNCRTVNWNMWILTLRKIWIAADTALPPTMQVYEMMNHMGHINLKLCITNIGCASLEVHVTGKRVLSCPQKSLFILSNWIIQIAEKYKFSFQDGDITSYNRSYACVLELVQIYGLWNVRKVSCDCAAHQVQVQSVSQLPWHCDVLLTDKHALHVKTFPQSCDFPILCDQWHSIQVTLFELMIIA